MKTLSYFAASAAQVARHPVEVVKLEWKGATGLAAARFLQVHDAYAAPANTAVPLKCWPIYTDAPGFKLFDVGELVLTNGLYICISTTEATKTLASGSDAFSTLTVELREDEKPSDKLFVGDLVNDVDVVEVWPDASGPKRLYEIIAKNNSPIVMYLQIHASQSPTNESLVEYFTVGVNKTVRLTFGKDGREISKKVGGQILRGCVVNWSLNPTIYDPDPSGTIQAEFK